MQVSLQVMMLPLQVTVTLHFVSYQQNESHIDATFRILTVKSRKDDVPTLDTLWNIFLTFKHFLELQTSRNKNLKPEPDETLLCVCVCVCVCVFWCVCDYICKHYSDTCTTMIHFRLSTHYMYLSVGWPYTTFCILWVKSGKGDVPTDNSYQTLMICARNTHTHTTITLTQTHTWKWWEHQKCSMW
jgi:hypothetical protein